MMPTHRQHDQQRGQGAGCLGKERIAETDQSVGPGLEQQPGQDHAAGGRCIGVGVGKPGMQRNDREFDRKGQQKGGIQPESGCRGELGSGQCGSDRSCSCRSEPRESGRCR